MLNKLKFLIIAVIIFGINGCLGFQNNSQEKIQIPAEEDTLTKIINRNKIIIGVESHSPPFGFIGEDGKNQGLEIDIARYITNEILGSHDRLQLVPIFDASKKVQLLKEKKVDLVIARMKDTPPLREEIDLSENYYASGIGLLTLKNNGISQWKQLIGKKVCTIRGDLYNKKLSRFGIEVIDFRSFNEVYLALEEKKCVGFAYDNTVIVGILRDSQWSDKWHQGLPIIFGTPWGMGISKGDVLFKKAVNDAILKMEAEGFIVDREKKLNIPPTEYALERMKRAKEIEDLRQISTNQVPKINQRSFSLTDRNILIDGSKTVFSVVYPIAQQFMEDYPDVKIAVGISGTGIGFEKFCEGELDISNASRAINNQEQRLCAENGIEYVGIPLALDGISVVVHPKNDWLTCLTRNELREIWHRDVIESMSNWNQLHKSYPNRQLIVFHRGMNSEINGYQDVILGNFKGSRKDYIPNDDNILIEAIANLEGSIGFVNFASYQKNQEKVSLVAITNNRGKCVKPSPESIADGSYNPLTHELFFYVNKNTLRENSAVKAFTEYLISPENNSIISNVGYIPLTPETFMKQKEIFE